MQVRLHPGEAERLLCRIGRGYPPVRVLRVTPESVICGFEQWLAGDGRVGEHIPFLVVQDLRRPRYHGPARARFLRQLRKGNNIFDTTRGKS